MSSSLPTSDVADHLRIQITQIVFTHLHHLCSSTSSHGADLFSFSFSFSFFFHPIYYLRPSILSPSYFNSRNSDPGSHTSRLFSPPTHYDSCLAYFYREKISALASLVDSRRIVLTHTRRSQQLIHLLFLQINSKISPRRDSNSRTNTSSIRGLPLVRRGDRYTSYVRDVDDLYMF